MKIAVVSEDQHLVSQHYGRAKHFIVMVVEDGEVVARETRYRPGALDPLPQSHIGEEHSPGRGRRSAKIVADCDALIAGGMGRGAYENLRQMGVEPVLTDVRQVEKAALAYEQGELVHQEERLHDGRDEDTPLRVAPRRSRDEH